MRLLFQYIVHCDLVERRSQLKLVH